MSARTPHHEISLELPSSKFVQSYVECLKEFEKEDPSRKVKWEWFENFDLYLDYCRQETENPDRPKGHVPQTTYWIVCDGKTAAGKFVLRHELTDRLEKVGGHIGFEVRPSFRKKGIASAALRLGLEEAKKRGIQKVLITCDEDNLASIKVLETNHGVLIGSYSLPDWPKSIRKYQFT